MQKFPFNLPWYPTQRFPFNMPFYQMQTFPFNLPLYPMKMFPFNLNPSPPRRGSPLTYPYTQCSTSPLAYPFTPCTGSPSKLPLHPMQWFPYTLPLYPMQRFPLNPPTYPMQKCSPCTRERAEGPGREQQTHLPGTPCRREWRWPGCSRWFPGGRRTAATRGGSSPAKLSVSPSPWRAGLQQMKTFLFSPSLSLSLGDQGAVCTGRCQSFILWDLSCKFGCHLPWAP